MLMTACAPRNAPQFCITPGETYVYRGPERLEYRFTVRDAATITEDLREDGEPVGNPVDTTVSVGGTRFEHSLFALNRDMWSMDRWESEKLICERDRRFKRPDGFTTAFSCRLPGAVESGYFLFDKRVGITKFLPAVLDGDRYFELASAQALAHPCQGRR